MTAKISMFENSKSVRADFCNKLFLSKQKESVLNFADFKGDANLQCKENIEESNINLAVELH